MQSGTIKFYYEKMGWGFISPDDGSPDLLVPASALPSHVAALDAGQRVSFEAADGKIVRVAVEDHNQSTKGSVSGASRSSDRPD